MVNFRIVVTFRRGQSRRSPTRRIPAFAGMTSEEQRGLSAFCLLPTAFCFLISDF
jgi:hypothetical protein